MKSFNNFISECYKTQLFEDAGDKFAAMDDTQFADYLKGTPASAEKAKKLRDAAKAKVRQGNKSTQTVRDAFNRGKERVKGVAQNLKDKASKVADTTPRQVAQKVAQKASDVKTKLQYGRTIKPDASTSALTNRSSSLANVSKASKALRIAGRVAGPAAAALDVASERSKGSSWLRSLAKGAVTAVGGAAGGAAGSAAGPVGTVVGSVAGSTAASKAFDVAAGKNAVERAADRVKNRQRQAGGALVGTGGKTSFDNKKNTMTTGNKTVNLAKTSVVKDPKSGKAETGNLAYKDGKAVYKRADAPGTGSSNAFERIGRTLNPNAYKANDAKLAAQKLNQAKANDVARNNALGIKPKK